MRPLERKRQLLLGERVVVVRLDGIRLAAEPLVGRHAQMSCCVRILIQRPLAGERIAFVRLYAGHADYILR